MGEGGGLGSVLRVQPDIALLDAAEDVREAVDVHRFVHAVVDGLADDRVVGDLDGAGLVLLAADELREDRRHQVVGAHALDLGRHLLALALAEDGERAGGVPAPARAEHRRDEERLLDRFLGPLWLHEVEHIGERKAVVRADRDEHRVVAGRRLQLEVKADAEALAEGEAPGAVDAAAEGGVNNELHAAAFVEEALEDDVLLRGDEADAVSFGADVANDLFGAFGGGVAFVGHPADGVGKWLGGKGRSGVVGVPGNTSPRPRWRPPLLPPFHPKGRHYIQSAEAIGHVLAEAGDLFRELHGAGGGLAEPEGDAGRLAVGVFDAHDADFNAADAPGGGAEEDNVAGHALDREVFVERANEGAFGFGQHAIVGDLGDRAAALDGGHARAAAAADDAGDAVAVKVGSGLAGAYGDAFAEHLDDLVEAAPLQFGVWSGLAKEVEEVVLAPGLAGRFGDDLLGENVERRDGREEPVEPPGLDGADRRGALEKLVAGRREEPSLRREAERVARAADALEEGRHATRRLDLADEVDRADVDAQLEGGGGDESLHLAGLEALLEVEPPLFGEAAMMSADVLLVEALRQE